MSEAGYVHGATNAREVARLEKQAHFVSKFVFPTLEFQAGQRVLDLATGVGAMGALLLKAFPGIELVGVDLSATQLAAARQNHPDLAVLQANATRLPFAAATFDRVHCSWLLEHVPNPVEVLKEVRRVLRPGGACHFVEVDNATFGSEPDCQAVLKLLERLNDAQQRAGGDPFVGGKLEGAFSEAGFVRFTVEPKHLVGDSSDPHFFQDFVEEFAEIFESLEESLGVEAHTLISAAALELRRLPQLQDGSMRFAPSIAKAWR